MKFSSMSKNKSTIILRPIDKDNNTLIISPDEFKNTPFNIYMDGFKWILQPQSQLIVDLSHNNVTLQNIII